jgi:hypothetical protein
MAAIKTDRLRIINAQQFAAGITTSSNSTYIFVGLPNPTSYNPNWNTSPDFPRDNFSQENDYWDTMIALKKINADDVRLAVKKNLWTSGTTYDMYRHDISVNNTAKPSNATSLYTSNYFVINSNYQCYICLNNGTNPEYVSGKPSLDEPLFDDPEPTSAGTSGDGYIWKYLFTIKPSEIIKFDNDYFIPLPRTWTSSASLNDQLKTIIIKNRGVNVGPPNSTYTNVPIKGDGSGATATIVINNESKVESIVVSSGGANYTYGSVDLAAGGVPLGSTRPEFDVIIPPPGGHGADVYNELGAYRVLIQTIIENDLQNPDFIQDNEYARIGIVQNPLQPNSTSKLTTDKVSALYALKLVGTSNANDYKNAVFNKDSLITQTIGTGITAVGRVATYDSTTGILKYWQDRSLVGFNTDGSSNNNPTYGFNMNLFTATPTSPGNLIISGETNNLNLQIHSTFTGISTVINNRTYQLGQSFVNGLSNPEVKKYSGTIIYVDNRPATPRSPNQKEYIKINIQL